MNSFTDLCRGRYFIIPENQRGYSWQPKQILDVFDDLRLAATHAHYMGPVIVSRTSTPDFQDADLNTVVEFCLEDGQQRMTTLMLIANQIRKHLLDMIEGPDLDTSELERLLFYNHQGIKLRLQNRNPELQQHFEHILRGAPAPPSRRTPPMRAMEDADSFISQWLDRNAPNIPSLKHWKQKLLNQAKFIWVDLASEGINRYLAFDAINSRGLPLSEFDKIKNFCILIAECRGLPIRAEEMWYAAIASLESYQAASRADEAAYITEYFCSFYNVRVGQGSIHAEFVRRYRKLLSGADEDLARELDEFVRGWEDYADSFGFLISPNRTSYYGTKCNAAAGAWLDRLENMDLPTITRPILAACHLRFTASEFADVARACEVYTFRVYATLRIRKDTNANAIISVAHHVLRAGMGINAVKEHICTWLRDMAPMRDFLLVLADGKPKYNFDPDTRGWPACYYFLYEYEIGRSPRGVLPIPWQSSREGKINTQEHILPQTHRDDGWWQAHWPDEAAADAFKHRLGNLVLTSNNAALGRKAFPLKLEDSSADHCFTHANATNSEKEITRFTDGQNWQRPNILAREAGMIRWAAERWAIPCCSDSVTISLPEEFSELPEDARSFQLAYANCIEEHGRTLPNEQAVDLSSQESGPSLPEF